MFAKICQARNEAFHRHLKMRRDCFVCHEFRSCKFASANFSLKYRLSTTLCIIARLMVCHVRPRVMIWIRAFCVHYVHRFLSRARARTHTHIHVCIHRYCSAAVASLARLVSPHQRPRLCRRVEDIRAHNSPYKQNLPMDNARAFVIFQKPYRLTRSAVPLRSLRLRRR